MGGGWKKILGAAALTLFAGAASAADAGTMMMGLGESIPSLMRLAAKAIPIVGFALIVGAILALPRVQTGKATLKQVAWTFLTGSAMIALGSSMGSMADTLKVAAGASNVLAGEMVATSGSGGQCGTMGAILGWVQFIGLVAFGRGLWLFHRHGNGTENDGLGRGFMHLIGGSAALNIYSVAHILANTFKTTAALSILCIG